MEECAYCDVICQPTREHVIPRWYNDTPGDAETFSARAPLTHVQGDLIVKDVCQTCNSGPLANLDGYGKELYERYFATTVYVGETVDFEYDGDRLLRWLLKLSYNSARAQNADSRVLHEYRDVILGNAPFPKHVFCWLHLVAASFIDSSTSAARPANQNERGLSSVDEPLWFRIGQFRLPSFPAIQLVQRTVVINSFAFTLVVDRVGSTWPNPELEQWSNVFMSGFPEASQLRPHVEKISLSTGDDHSITSISPLFHHCCPLDELVL